jgi:hypothetical protein
MLPLRCFSGLATVTDAATLRARSGRYTVLKSASDLPVCQAQTYERV